MDSYYHAFEIGFNAVYVMAPLRVVIFCITSYFVGRSLGYLKDSAQRGVDRAALIISVFLTGITFCEVLDQCGDGIIQVIINVTLGPSDSPVWSLVVMSFIVGVMAICYLMVCLLAAGSFYDLGTHANDGKTEAKRNAKAHRNDSCRPNKGRKAYRKGAPRVAGR